MSDTDAIREIAKVQLAHATDARQRMSDEHSASFRWLMASFLAINSGGLFLLKGLEFKLFSWEILASMSFYIGIVSSLALAWLGQIACRKGMMAMAESEAFWAASVAHGEIDRVRFEEVVKEVQKSAQPGLARYAGWISLAAFSVGLFATSFGTKQIEQPSHLSPSMSKSGK